MIASAPGKLIVSGEYAVLDGAPALVVAVDRRVVARRGEGERSPFLDAVSRELGARGFAAPAVRVDSSAFYENGEKLGLGSSAAVTVAATACALGRADRASRDEILAIALAAHANAQGDRGARGSGADVAAAVHGGTIVFAGGRVEARHWPAGVTLVPFHTGATADTATLVARVAAARTSAHVEAALAAIADASRDVIAAMLVPQHGVVVDGVARAAARLIDPSGDAATSAIVADDASVAAAIAAFDRAGDAFDQLARATGVELVPPCVIAARQAVRPLGGTAKTTGAGGGDVGIALVPATVDVSHVAAALIEAGCRPLRLSVDLTGVDVRADVR